MFNFLAINVTLPGEVANMAGSIAEPGYMGNILVLLLALVVVGLYGFFLDRHHMVIILFATYVGFLVANYFPTTQWKIGDWADSWWGVLVIFLVGILISVIIIGKTHILRSKYTGNILVRWYQAFVSGILITGLLMSIVLPVLPGEFLKQFSPWFLNIFISDIAGFLWFVLPVLGLLFIGSKKRGPGRPSY